MALTMCLHPRTVRSRTTILTPSSRRESKRFASSRLKLNVLVSTPCGNFSSCFKAWKMVMAWKILKTGVEGPCKSLNLIVGTMWVKKFPPPSRLVAIFPKWLGIFQPNFTCLLCVPIYARLWIFIQLPATLTKLCHIKHDHPVHTMCAKCPPSAETHAGIFWHFTQTVKNF